MLNSNSVRHPLLHPLCVPIVDQVDRFTFPNAALAKRAVLMGGVGSDVVLSVFELCLNHPVKVKEAAWRDIEWVVLPDLVVEVASPLESRERGWSLSELRGVKR